MLVPGRPGRFLSANVMIDLMTGHLQTHPRTTLLARYSGVHLVFVGGGIGALIRYLVDVAAPRPGGFALDIFLINILGAFLLALAVGFITGEGEPTRRQLRFRLFFGTGMMGGFTTYSTLAVETAHLTGEGRWAGALLYSLGTVIVGAALSVLGLFAGRRWAQARALEAASREES